jgi:hypothetical protein
VRIFSRRCTERERLTNAIGGIVTDRDFVGIQFTHSDSLLTRPCVLMPFIFGKAYVGLDNP